MHYIELPYTLFYDPQGAIPADFCIQCGCERYAPGLHCLHCERRREYELGRAEPQL